VDHSKPEIAMANAFAPSQVRFSRVIGKTELRIRFEFPATEKRKPIVWEVTFDDAMKLLHALQGIQAKYKIPIPPSLRPSGKPKLAVVKLNGET
jgi:hypothetical protein